jgi:hypothetical protein
LRDRLTEHRSACSSGGFENRSFSERPADYLKIVASLVPKQMEIDDRRTNTRAEDLSDDELAAIATSRTESNGHLNAHD